MVSKASTDHLVRFFTDFNSCGYIEFVMGRVCIDVKVELLDRGPFAESGAIAVMRQVAAAQSTLHSLHVAHRHFNLEDMFLSTLERSDAVVNICDLGFISITSSFSGCITFCCTLACLAPGVYISRTAETNSMATRQTFGALGLACTW